MDRFVALDFETATPDRSSACALGLVVVDGDDAHGHHWLICPPGNEYYAFNSYVHGLGPKDTASSPPFAEVIAEALDVIGDRLVVAHNAGFDLSVLRACLSACGRPWPTLDLACTAVLAKRAWPGLASYSLPFLVAHHDLGEFDHHNAVADAAACAMLVTQVLTDTGAATIADAAASLDVRLGRLEPDRYRACGSVYAPSSSIASRLVAPDPSTIDWERPLAGARVAFTGTLASMERAAAAQLVVNAGGTFSPSVTKTTNYLVFGEQDFSKFVDGAMSGKTRKALALIEAGAPLQIVGEDDFLRLVWSSGPGEPTFA